MAGFEVFTEAMNGTEEKLASVVRQFIVNETGVIVGKVKDDTRLREDLGIEGNDAVDLLDRFAEVFSVDISNLDFCRHFGPEAGFSVFWLLVRMATGTQTYLVPICVRDLITAARERRWPDHLYSEETTG